LGGLRIFYAWFDRGQEKDKVYRAKVVRTSVDHALTKIIRNGLDQHSCAKTVTDNVQTHLMIRFCGVQDRGSEPLLNSFHGKRIGPRSYDVIGDGFYQREVFVIAEYCRGPGYADDYCLVFGQILLVHPTPV